MRKKIIFVLLIVMVLMSLFTAYAINGNFVFLYSYAFVDFPERVLRSLQRSSGSINVIEIIQGGVLIVSHIGMILLPMLYYKYESKKVLIIIPLVFLFAQLSFLTIFGIILIPFAVIWFIVLYLYKKEIEDKSLVEKANG
ncbi:hypothetical protein D3C87_566820 [compost metagenome]